MSSDRVLNFSEFAGKYNTDTQQDDAAAFSDLTQASDNFQDAFDETSYEDGIKPNRPLNQGDGTVPTAPGDEKPGDTEGMEAPDEIKTFAEYDKGEIDNDDNDDEVDGDEVDIEGEDDIEDEGDDVDIEDEDDIEVENEESDETIENEDEEDNTDVDFDEGGNPEDEEDKEEDEEDDEANESIKHNQSDSILESFDEYNSKIKHPYRDIINRIKLSYT